MTCLIIDLTVLIGGGFLASWLLEAIEYSSPDEALSQDRTTIVLFAVAVYLLFSKLVRGYSARRILEAGHALRRILPGLVLTFALLLTLGAALKATQNYSRLWFFSWAALSCSLVVVVHSLFILRIQRALQRGACIFRAMTVGVGCPPLDADAVAMNTGFQDRVFLSTRIEAPERLGDVAAAAIRHAIDDIYVTAPWREAPALIARLRSIPNISANVHVLPLDAALPAPLGGATFGDQLALSAATRPLQGWRLWQKRAFDVSVATLLLTATLPVMAVIMIAIRLESRGPFLFRQKRTGFNGESFQCWKFRTMYWEQRDADAAQQTLANDPRVTRVGRFIRKTSLDELPQFINVLQGHMSVVGPRPHALATSADGRLLRDVLDEYVARHRVKPGVTGWAQVNGARGAITTAEQLRRRVALDLEYIENWSVLLDLRIVLRTVWLVFRDARAH